MEDVEVKGKKTVVLGASQNPDRYSYSAVMKLKEKGHVPVPVGIKHGNIEGVDIMVGRPQLQDVHTISLYLGAERQKPLYDYILSLRPDRIIFNPGAENSELAHLARLKDIEVINGCTLVMLAINAF